MAKEKDKRIVIDRNFPVPPGVTGVSQDDDQALTEASDAGGPETGTPLPLPVTQGTAVFPADASLAQVIQPTPVTTLTFVEQRIRITDDGRAVVDAVVEIGGILDGQYAVDLRVTKL